MRVVAWHQRVIGVAHISEIALEKNDSGHPRSGAARLKLSSLRRTPVSDWPARVVMLTTREVGTSGESGFVMAFRMASAVRLRA